MFKVDNLEKSGRCLSETLIDLHLLLISQWLLRNFIKNPFTIYVTDRRALLI